MNCEDCARHLDHDIVALVAYVSSQLDASKSLEVQANLAIVEKYSSTMIDVNVPAPAPIIDLPDGPIPGRFLVYRAGKLSGEVLVWVKAGRLIGLEQTWYDNLPESWPAISDLRLA
jgi:hypothetical protein